MITVQEALAGREFAAEIDDQDGFLLMDAVVILRYEDNQNRGVVIVETEGTDLLVQSGLMAHGAARIDAEVRQVARDDL